MDDATQAQRSSETLQSKLSYWADTQIAKALLTFQLRAVQDVIIFQITYPHRTSSGSLGIHFMGAVLKPATIAEEREPEVDATSGSQARFCPTGRSARHFLVTFNNGFQL